MIRTLTNILCFMLFFLGAVNAQVEYESHTLNSGDTLVFAVESDLPAIRKGAVSSHSTVTIIPMGSDLYEVQYVADASFIGEDQFVIESYTVTPPFPFPTPTTTIHTVSVRKSSIFTETDVVTVTPGDTLELFPLLNDQTNADSIYLAGISHVQLGQASATDSSTIIYIAPETSFEADILTYTAMDSEGGFASGSIYVVGEVLEVSDLSLYTNEDEAVYFYLPEEDFAPQVGNSPAGGITNLGEGVYTYLPAEVGVDSFVMTDTAGTLVTCYVTVYSTKESVSFVKKDDVYTAVNEEVIFNVFENDLFSTYPITDHSNELDYLGGGIFAYLPDQNFTGKKAFTYTVDVLGTQYEGEISLRVANFEPVNYFTYNFDVPRGKSHTLDYQQPIETEFFEVVTAPAFGELTNNDGQMFSTFDCGIVDGTALVYTPYDAFVGTDQFEVEYCPSNDNPCRLVKIEIEVFDHVLDSVCNCIQDCVYPGDANDDGKVSILDVLAVANVMGDCGAQRAQNAFTAQNAISTNSYTMNHADCDGDGIISSADIEVIADQYGAINSLISNDVLAVKNVPFYVIPQNTQVDSGELMVLDIYIGNEAYPAKSFAGLAFSLNMNPDVMDSASVSVDYVHDGYFVKNSPYIEYTHQPFDGVVHTAVSKVNGNTSNGFGLVAQLSFIVEEEAEGIRSKSKSRYSSEGGTVVPFTFDNIVITDADGDQFALEDFESAFTVKSQSRQVVPNHALLLSPNPATDYLTVSNIEATDNTTINVFSATGKTVLRKTVTPQSNSVSLSTIDLPNGVYFLRATSNGQMVTEKFVIQR